MPASTAAIRTVSPDGPFRRGATGGAVVHRRSVSQSRERLSLAILKGCVPVDGDTYDVPLQVATAAARSKSLGPACRRRWGIRGKVRTSRSGSATSPPSGTSRRTKGSHLLDCACGRTTRIPSRRRTGFERTRKAGVPAKISGLREPITSGLIATSGDRDPSTVELFAFVEAALKR